MALIRMTLDDVKAQAAARSPEEQAAFQRRMAATTEADIHRQMIEDGEGSADRALLCTPRPGPGRSQEARPDSGCLRHLAWHSGRHLA